MQESYLRTADFRHQLFHRRSFESGSKRLKQCYLEHRPASPKGSFFSAPLQEENATHWSGSFLEKARLYSHLGLTGKADMRGTMSGDQGRIQVWVCSSRSAGIPRYRFGFGFPAGPGCQALACSISGFSNQVVGCGI